MAMQSHDRGTQSKQLEQVAVVRLSGQPLTRQKKCAEEGQLALNEMKSELDHSEKEVAVLRSRRDQAEVESPTLDLVSSATAIPRAG